ncbi:MAG: exopolysaccharide biosynthesis polyprenyl glycosylphosphotransferase [Clostridia bacterium]|nr:exopolysaccharide biosynthesis polyprenyl glycosylphosphotransferase [Clostridia bacterium]
MLLSYWFASWFWLDVVVHLDNMARLPLTVVSACVYAVCAVVLLAFTGAYNPPRRGGFLRETAQLWLINLLGVGAAAAILYMLWLMHFSRGVLAVFYVTSCTLMTLRRLVQRLIAQPPRQVIVCGRGPLAQRYVQSVQREAPEIAIAGCLDDYTALEERLQDPAITEVVAALEPEDTGSMSEIIRICEKCGTKISIVPFYHEIIPASAAIESVGDTKVINLRANPLDNLGCAIVKRGCDIMLSLLLIILLLPVLLLTALLVKLTSTGPVLFRQQRVGRGKRLFTMYKFRSMSRSDAENSAWSTPDDPRKTPFGAFMRKFSIDELPQLFNVLKGDMSLVGPRPEIPHFVEQFRDSVPLYMVKHQVRPGMTGWAQVNGWRGDTSIVRRIEHDVWYIEHWSLHLDAMILLRTLFGGFINREHLRRKGDRS